jgi:hypothetical protein
MRHSISISIFVSSLILFAAGGVQLAHADDLALNQRWGNTVSAEEANQSPHFNPFRIMNRTYDSFMHFGVGAADLMKFGKKGHVADATYQFAESFLDPFDLTNSILSDVGAAIKSPHYIGRRMSTRIQICSGNLGLILDDGVNKYPKYSLILDVDHVGILVDNDEAFTDTGGGGLVGMQDKQGADCSAVPIMSNEPEEVAIQRLNYIARDYRPQYHFMTSNCGYFTRDILNASGFAYPIFPNAGIGTEVPVTIEQEKFKQSRQSDVKSLLISKVKSDIFLEKLRTLFNELENGTVPDVSFDAADFGAVTADTYLQILISATRGKNLDAQTWALNQFSQVAAPDNVFSLLWYGELAKQIEKNGTSKSGKRLYRQMMGGLDAADLQWFFKDKPIAQKQLTDVLNAILI